MVRKSHEDHVCKESVLQNKLTNLKVKESSEGGRVDGKYKLKSLLQKKGYREICVKGDGLCFYNALAVAIALNCEIYKKIKQALELTDSKIKNGRYLYEAICKTVKFNNPDGLESLRGARHRGASVFYHREGDSKWVNEDSIKHFIAPVLQVLFVLIGEDNISPDGHLSGHLISGENESIIYEYEFETQIAAESMFLLHAEDHWNLLIPPANTGGINEIVDTSPSHETSAQLLSIPYLTEFPLDKYLVPDDIELKSFPKKLELIH